MKKYLFFSGIMVMFAGIIIFATCLMPNSGNVNLRLLIGFATIVAGGFLQVYMLKKDSKY